MTTKAEIVAAIEGMSVLDLAELVKELEERLGVTAAAAFAVAAPAAAAGDAAPAEEEQFEFTVTLKEIGPNKIEVIKAVRGIGAGPRPQGSKRTGGVRPYVHQGERREGRVRYHQVQA